MSDDQVECEWVSVSSGTGLPGLSRTKAVNRLCVCVCVPLVSQKYCARMLRDTEADSTDRVECAVCVG